MEGQSLWISAVLDMLDVLDVLDMLDKICPTNYHSA